MLLWIILTLAFYTSAESDVSIDSNFGDQKWFEKTENFDPNEQYPKLKCNSHISTSLSPNEMKIYEFEITSNILDDYKQIKASTCCQKPSNYTGSYDEYCEKFSDPDTILYLLRIPPQTISSSTSNTSISIEFNDDDLTNQCYDEYNDTTKSLIDLSNENPGTYYIAVSANSGVSGGLVQLNLMCTTYSWPIEDDEFKIKESNDTMQCNDPLYHQTNTETNPISYYKISIDSNMKLPVTITTCLPLYQNGSEYSKYDTYLYLLKQIGTTQEIVSYSLVDINDIYILPNGEQLCDGYGSQLDLTNKEYGTYYVAVGGHMNLAGQFSLEMRCATQPEDLTMLIIVLVVVFVTVVIFCTFYYLQVKRIQKMYSTSINIEDEESVTDSNEDYNGSVDDEILEIDIENNGFNNDKDIEFMMSKMNEIDLQDAIIISMNEIIESFSKDEGLDIYQVLAFRAVDKKSKQMKLKQPFSKFMITTNILYLSSFQRVSYVAMVVFSLQVIGISIIMYSVSFAKFTNHEIGCYYHYNEWTHNSNWIYKILAFLWASVITLNIGIHQNRMRESGFTKLIDQIPNNMYPLINCIDIVILHIGLLSNLYTLFMAVLGSYFIIFTSLAGENVMEMVLNAVALFFLIELDDMLVTKNDYRDVCNGCKIFLKKYLNNKYESKLMPRVKSKNRFKQYDRKQMQSCGVKGMSRLTKCVEYFGFCIAGFTVLFGFIAPILIIICYDGFIHKN